MKYNILYFGDSRSWTNSLYRADALRRLGHEVMHFDLASGVKPQLFGSWLGRLHYRTGYRFLQKEIKLFLEKKIGGEKSYDVAWVGQGELFGVEAIRGLKRIARRVLLFTSDDPTGSRDGLRWGSLREAIPEYDLCAVIRNVSVAEFKERGARRVMRVWRGYDEQAHQPFSDISGISPQFRSDVAFIGTWMEGRDDFMAQLAEHKVPLAIWGDRWPKSPLWRKIKPFWRGVGLLGRDYVAAVQGAKICLGLLSHGNRDLYTGRSSEVPYAGGLLCAERTSEHQAMYHEGQEAVFWSDPKECARVCQELLEDAVCREAIRQAGCRRVLELKIGNEDSCRKILEEVSKTPGSADAD